MKLNLRGLLPFLAGVAVLYSACTKSAAVKPDTSNVKASDNVASSAIADNLAKSLAGSFGGSSVKDGVAPSINSSSKVKVQSTYSCGFYVDTALNYVFNQGDTLKATKTGGVQYYFVCENDKTVGYDSIDSLNTVGSGPGFSYVYNIVQKYKVRGVNTNNSNFSMEGPMKAYADNEYPRYKTFSRVHNTYVFKNLYIHGDDNFDITSGTATFHSEGKTNGGGWDYSGTITFLGNHKAKLTFLNKTFLVDLLTGTSTPA
ncbi:hypothetical protein [Mucilaginibacter kameinonensis]|uniref:hypothetical protein n=1 Tax=Mucilaginibacter kameinonensis TaxID=452286 RepID=UPI0013CEA6EA|nr:hypothetical protein [Mucilaginibacter kameinonensis]